MKPFKSALMGCGLAALALATAQAADLPVKKAGSPVQYVEACPAFGGGFYKLPGTDMCMKPFGSIKFNFAFQDERNAWFGPGDALVQAGASNTVGWQFSVRPGWDFRAPTEYGTLRNVVQLRVDQRNGVHENDDPVLTGAMRTNNLIYRGYIEWAGFLIGRAPSQFVYLDQEDIVTAIGGDPSTTTAQATYTFDAPGGVKATIGLEDSSAWSSSAGAFTDLTVGRGDIGDGPNRLFDIVATLSAEQGWGGAKLSGAIHFTQTNGDLDLNGAPDTTKIGTGWAVLGGVSFNLPTLGAKDQLLLEATYSDGAVAFSGINGGAENDFTAFERRGQFLNGLQNFWITDAYARNSSGGWELENTHAWSVLSQFKHYWAPLWRSNLTMSYHQADVPSIGFATTGFGSTSAWDAAFNLIWGQSRKTAEVGGEVAYKSTSQQVSPAIAAAAFRNNIDVNPAGWAISFFMKRAW
jgi:hypothetical protein